MDKALSKSIFGTAEADIRIFNEQMNEIKVFTEDRKQLIAEIPKPIGDLGVFTRDKTLFVVSSEKTVYIYDLQTKALLQQLDPEGGVKCISESNGYLVTGGTNGLSIFSKDETYKFVATITEEPDVRDVSVSPCGTWMASVHRNGNLCKWNIQFKGLEKKVTAHKTSGIAVTIFPDGLSIATAGRDRKLKIWNQSLEEIDECLIKGPHRCLQITPDNFIISAGESGMVVVWKYLKTKDYMVGKVSNKIKPIKLATATNDSKYLFIYDTSIRVFSLETKEEVLKFSVKNENIVSMCITSNDDRFIIVTASGKILSFNLHEDYKITHICETERLATKIAVSSDSKQLAATFDDRKLLMINLETKAIEYQTYDKAVISANFSSDNGLLICAHQDSTLRIKSLDKARADLVLSTHGEIKCLSCSSELFLTASGNRVVNLWSMGNNTCVKTMHIGCDSINGAIFSADAEYIVINADNDLQIWKVNDLSDIPVKLIMKPHSEIISIVAKNTASQFISIGSENLIKVWNFCDFTCEAIIGFPSNVDSINIKNPSIVSKDDKFLYTCSDEGIQIWSLIDLIYLGNLSISGLITFTLTADNASFIAVSADNYDIFEVVNPTHDCADPTMLGPMPYSFLFWELLRLIFNSRLEAGYPEIMNQCIIMPQCVNFLHIFTYKNDLDQLAVAMKNQCSFIRTKAGSSPMTLALDTKNKDCISQITRDVVLYEDPNTLTRLETDILRMNRFSTELLPYFYQNAFVEPNQKLLKFAIPLVMPTNYKISVNPEINLLDFVTPESRAEMRSDDDQLLNFRTSKFRVNFTLGSKESCDFLISIINCTESDILKAPLIKEMLFYKWSKVQNLLFVQVALYLLFMLALSLYTTALQDDTNALHGLLVLSVIFLVYEILQMTALAKDYFTDLWNILDLLRIFGIFAYYFALSLGYESDNKHVFLGLITFVTWIRAIAYFRVFKDTRYLIRMIQEIIIDMIPFLLVLMYSILTFALVFCVLSELSGTTKTFGDSWRDSYLMNYGEFDTDNYHFFEWMVFVVATMLNPLIMMNMLIALMGDTYARVQESAHVADMREMALFILELESVLVWRRDKGRKEYFQLCTVNEIDDEEEETDLQKFWEEKLEELGKKVALIGNEISIIEQRSSDTHKEIHPWARDVAEKLKVKTEEVSMKMAKTQQELLETLTRIADS